MSLKANDKMLVNSHLTIVIVLNIVFSIASIISVIRDIYKSQKITIMYMCRIMYIGILCVVPALILYGQMNGVKVIKAISFEHENVWTFYVQFILTVIGYFVLNFGYNIKPRIIKQQRIKDSQNIIFTTIVFSLISVVSLFMWASGYGGISNLLENANAIRSGFVSSSNSTAFFKHFVPLALLTSWMLFSLLMRKNVKKFAYKIAAILLLIINVCVSSIYLQANDGRFLLAAYILLFFLIHIKYLYEVKSVNIIPLFIKLGVVAIIVGTILFNADKILRFMRGDTIIETSGSGIVKTISTEFYFIITGTQKSLLEWFSGDGKLMIVNDVINGLFAWLPTSFKPIILEDVWDYNTRIIEPSSYGQAPTTIVAQSVYDLGLIGIIVIPFLYGMLIKRVEKILEARKNNVFFDTIYVALGFYLCKGIVYFSLYNIMINIFFIFIGAVIYSVLRRFKV